ncbi:MAG: quinolinate synthase NadA, partial [Gammaproteobacteria bacterium]|nr:quinolinate synthase NadA [Gammaproteobacteria bacterium]
PHMNEITLEQTRDALLYNQYQIELPEDIMDRARRPIERMLRVG